MSPEASQTAPRLLGLTGGIGSGKSTAARWFSELGLPTLSADELGHRLLQPGHPAVGEIVSTFGPDVVDASGAVNRVRLGSLVFSDAQALQRLNEITHPRIAQLVEEESARLALERPDRWVVLEAALLLEARWSTFCEQIWVVESPPEVVIERLRARNGFTAEQAQARLDAQLSNEARRVQALVVLQNDSTLERFHAQWYAAVRKHLKLLDSHRSQSDPGLKRS